LRFRVAPGAAASEVVGRHGEAWKLRVAAAPERGRANDAVQDLLADTLGLDRLDVRVVAGVAARDKVVEITGLTRDEAERRLDRAGRKETG
jgi:uncharacterized protein YggU (UPF0235/DUF167 family)